MAEAKTAENWIAKIHCALDDDILLLRALSGTEELSRLFRFQLEMVSDNRNVDFAEVVGVDHVVVGQRRRHPSLVEEHRDHIGAGGELLAEHLDHELLGEALDPRVVSPIDLRHPPGRDVLDQDVLLAEWRGLDVVQDGASLADSRFSAKSGAYAAVHGRRPRARGHGIQSAHCHARNRNHHQ